MIDPYGTLIEMTATGKKPEEIAAATGWPAEAVATMQEEILCRDSKEITEPMADDGVWALKWV